ncbi:MAG TPA: hypothetical protein VGL99_03820, partial [Chloroflexota bacterium]
GTDGVGLNASGDAAARISDGRSREALIAAQPLRPKGLQTFEPARGACAVRARVVLLEVTDPHRFG